VSTPNTSDPPWIGNSSEAFLLGLYLGLTLLLLLSYLDQNHASALHFWTNIYGVQAVAGAVLGWYQIRKRADDPRKTPALSSVWICLGLAGWAIGQGLWILGTFTVGAVPYPWWSDLLYIASVLCWLVALLTVYKSLRRRGLTEIIPYMGILTTTLGLLVGVFYWLDREKIASPLSNATLPEIVCDLIYILLTFLTVVPAIALLLGENTEIPLPVHKCILYLCAATAIDAGATLAFTVTTKLKDGQWAYFNGNWVDWLFLTTMYCWGVSALKCPLRQEDLTYTFGTTRSGLQVGDICRAAEIAEECSLAAQMIDPDAMRWILDNIPECWRVVKLGESVVGSTFLFPVPRHLKERFLKGTTTGREMFEEVMKNPLTWDGLYLADASILKQHRKRGLAFECFKTTIENIAQEHDGHKIEVFCCPDTLKRKKLAEKLRRHFEGRGIFIIKKE